MKTVIGFAMLLMPLLLSAQNFPVANPQQMQLMMQKAKEMQACMQQLDQVKMHAYQQRATRLGEQVKALCAAGKRAEALSTAISFSQEIAADSVMKEVKRCSEIMQQGMPDFTATISDYQEGSADQHICDQW